MAEERVDAERVAQMRQMLAAPDGGEAKVRQRFGESVTDTEEYAAAQRQLRASRERQRQQREKAAQQKTADKAQRAQQARQRVDEVQAKIQETNEKSAQSQSQKKTHAQAM